MLATILSLALAGCGDAIQAAEPTSRPAEPSVDYDAADPTLEGNAEPDDSASSDVAGCVGLDEADMAGCEMGESLCSAMSAKELARDIGRPELSSQIEVADAYVDAQWSNSSEALQAALSAACAVALE